VLVSDCEEGVGVGVRKASRKALRMKEGRRGGDENEVLSIYTFIFIQSHIIHVYVVWVCILSAFEGVCF